MKIMSVIQCFEILECKGKYCFRTSGLPIAIGMRTFGLPRTN